MKGIRTRGLGFAVAAAGGGRRGVVLCGVGGVCGGGAGGVGGVAGGIATQL